MTASPLTSADLAFHPVTADRWPDLERLFGPRGAYFGCWCMFWRLRRAEFDRSSAEERRTGLKGLVDSGQVPGILAYAGDEPIAWVSLGPRESFLPLERSRTLKRVDEQPVWAIVCFFVAKPHRRQGLMVRLLQGAVAYAASQGAQIVEGYPVDPDEGHRVSGGSEGYMGLASAFRKAGFVEVARPSENRMVMRFSI
ncbi:MAG: GNAT family N-acetyltransferase [Chloroflexi bacterium]|nr:GNAT family N-acetyltransferase [Chloroflexota bacterium]